MAIIRQDEILEKAISGDPSAVPRYNLRAPDGSLLGENIALELANAVAQMGTPVNAAALNEMLAASGVTAGAASAYTLEQGSFALFDGAPVRFRLHTASGTNATLNVNGTGAKPIKTTIGDGMPSGIPAGMWVNVIYSATADAYILTGGSVSSAQIAAWNEKPTTAQAQTIATNAAETQTKILARTQLSSDTAEITIPIPSGYRRIRLTATLKPAAHNEHTDMTLTTSGTVRTLRIGYDEPQYKFYKGSTTGIRVGKGSTSRVSHAMVEMIKLNNGRWQGHGYLVDWDYTYIDYPEITFFTMDDFAGTSFNISKSTYKIAAGSLFVLEGLK